MNPTLKSRAYSRRRRFVTACTECHRRKQKCNRGVPCDICIARKVPNLCSYNNNVTHNLQSAGHDIVQAEDTFVEEVLLDSHDLVNQMGYSSTFDKSVFRSLALDDTPASKRLVADKPHTGVKDKYCRLLRQIPFDDIVRKIIDLWFVEANWVLLVLEKYFFKELYTSWLAIKETAAQNGPRNDLPRDLQYFPALLFQMMAVALQFMPSDSEVKHTLCIVYNTSIDALSRKFSILGVEIMALLGRHKPALTSVQHDLLRVQWLKNQGRGTDSWNILGSAIRQAQELGLHLQPAVSFNDADNEKEMVYQSWYQEYRKRIWVTIFNCDAHMSLILGRPRTIHVDDCTIVPPIDCDIPEELPSTIASAIPAQKLPSSYTPQVFQYAMAHKIHEMYASGAVKSPVPDYTKVTELHKNITKLVNELPPAVRPENPDTSWDSQLPSLPKQREQITCIAWSYLMSLHRPHVTTHVESGHAAIECALRTMDSQEKLVSLLDEHHYVVYGFSFYTIDAAIFLSTLLVDSPLEGYETPSRIDLAFDQAIARLDRMKKRSVMAANGVEVVRKCHQRIKHVLQRKSISLGQISSSEESDTLTASDASFPVCWPACGDSAYYANNFSEVLDPGKVVDETSISGALPLFQSDDNLPIFADSFFNPIALESADLEDLNRIWDVSYF